LLAGELAVAFGGVRIGGHDTQFLSNFRADFLIVLLSSVDFIGLGRTVAPLKVLPVSSWDLHLLFHPSFHTVFAKVRWLIEGSLHFV
jgi:hypothetical protein